MVSHAATTLHCEPKQFTNRRSVGRGRCQAYQCYIIPYHIISMYTMRIIRLSTRCSAILHLFCSSRAYVYKVRFPPDLSPIPSHFFITTKKSYPIICCSHFLYIHLSPASPFLFLCSFYTVGCTTVPVYKAFSLSFSSVYSQYINFRDQHLPVLAWLGIQREVHTAPSTTNSETVTADATVPTLVQDSSNGKK